VQDILQAWNVATVQEALNMNRKLKGHGKTWADVEAWLQKEFEERAGIELTAEEVAVIRAQQGRRVRRLPKALREKLWKLEGWGKRRQRVGGNGKG
jgi:hypothetical protein